MVAGAETPEATAQAGVETPAEGTGGAGFDLAEAPAYSGGEPWGDINDRLGYADGGPIFTDAPDSIGLEHEYLRVERDDDDGATALSVCAERCEPATRESGDGAYADSPIGWVGDNLIYQRQTEDGTTEIRSLIWDPNAAEPASDELVETVGGPADPVGPGYPVGDGILIPTASAWLLATEGSVSVIDQNPYGQISLVRTSFNEPLIAYVAGGELIVAERTSPGTPRWTLPFSGVDYDISPDVDRVVISTGNGLEIWSLDGELLGASGTSIQTGSVLWLSGGIILLDQTNGIMRLLDPAQIVP
jgi:hypothetical protein